VVGSAVVLPAKLVAALAPVVRPVWAPGPV
jgi:hypothetical protein